MVDLIPGINVGNIFKQAGSFVGLAPQGDYDIFDNLTVSNRPGQFNLVPPQGNSSSTLAANPAQQGIAEDANGGYTGDGSYASGNYVSPQQAQQNALLSQLPGQINTILGTSNEAAVNAGRGIGSSLRDYGFQQRQGQNAINQRGIQNEASRRQSSGDILGMVGRGITSGGRTLANKNAGTSSAAGEIARAYGQIGQREMSKVGNQYALGENARAADQGLFNEQQGIYRQNFAANKESIVGSIVSNAQSQLAELDSALRGASLPDRIAIEAEKNKIRDSARNELAQFDAMLAQEQASAKATSGEENRTKAAELSQLGQAPANQFDYNAETPTGWQGQAPAGGNLPIFTFPRGRKQVA